MSPKFPEKTMPREQTADALSQAGHLHRMNYAAQEGSI